ASGRAWNARIARSRIGSPAMSSTMPRALARSARSRSSPGDAVSGSAMAAAIIDGVAASQSMGASTRQSVDLPHDAPLAYSADHGARDRRGNGPGRPGVGPLAAGRRRAGDRLPAWLPALGPDVGRG